jgi:hypothetical protein
VRFLVAFLAAFASWPACGALPSEIQVYTDDIEAPGERGVELHVNTSPRGRDAPDYPGEVVPQRGWRITPELSWGLAPDWDWAIYLPFVRSGDGTNYLGSGTALGLEYYADLGRLSHFAPRAEQAHTLYFVVDTKRVNFGVGKGIRGAADPWTLKAIFSF